jgi:hypothetical protein
MAPFTLWQLLKQRQPFDDSDQLDANQSRQPAGQAIGQALNDRWNRAIASAPASPMAFDAANGASAAAMPQLYSTTAQLAPVISSDTSAEASDTPAQNIAGSRPKDICIERCYRLLERKLPFPASDKNLWDFHKCVNDCMAEFS